MFSTPHCCFFAPYPASPDASIFMMALITSGSDRNGAATAAPCRRQSGAGQRNAAGLLGCFQERATALRLIGPTVPNPES